MLIPPHEGNLKKSELARRIVLSVIAIVCYTLLLTLGNYFILSFISDRYFGQYYVINFLAGVGNAVFIAFLLLPLLKLPKTLNVAVVLISFVISCGFWMSQMIYAYGLNLALRGLLGLQSRDFGGFYISVWEILFFVILTLSISSFSNKLRAILALSVMFEIWFLFESALRVYLTTSAWNIIPYGIRILLLLIVVKYVIPIIAKSEPAGSEQLSDKTWKNRYVLSENEREVMEDSGA